MSAAPAGWPSAPSRRGQHDARGARGPAGTPRRRRRAEQPSGPSLALKLKRRLAAKFAPIVRVSARALDAQRAHRRVAQQRRVEQRVGGRAEQADRDEAAQLRRGGEPAPSRPDGLRPSSVPCVLLPSERRLRSPAGGARCAAGGRCRGGPRSPCRSGARASPGPPSSRPAPRGCAGPRARRAWISSVSKNQFSSSTSGSRRLHGLAPAGLEAALRVGDARAQSVARTMQVVGARDELAQERARDARARARAASPPRGRCGRRAAARPAAGARSGRWRGRRPCRRPRARRCPSRRRAAHGRGPSRAGA